MLILSFFHLQEKRKSFGAERKIVRLRLKNHLAQKNPQMKANLFRSTLYLQTHLLGI
ncbi:conserved domain protein [Paraprevotella xylaniphila YIT 11841]|uniref:Conserved domain protein n=1 Tax=Paraprevotella xylaniphila YIT 11841 TaxID=762982 RepID=F3QUK9_9BACT|nr:conserved domain protein [Paraprevotella xylaniphila YIT 11841]